MTDAIRLMLEVGASASATATLVQYVIKQSVQHFLETERLRFSEELKRVSQAQESALQLWTTQQTELFKQLIEAKAATMQKLVSNASLLRRAIHGIAEKRDPELVDIFYRRYCEAFYRDPVLPSKLFEAAHSFRQVVQKVIGACVVAGSRQQLDKELVRELDDSYATLLKEARSVLLPVHEA